MILSITAAAKAAGVSRTTIYEKVNAGELSRTSEGIDTAELLRVFGELKSDKPNKPESDQKAEQGGDDLTLWLREKLDTAEQELKQARSALTDTTADLLDTKERLHEHREAARLLEHKSEEWKQALSERQAEIETARRESAELADKLQRESEDRAKAESLAKALEARGLLARLFNRKPVVS